MLQVIHITDDLKDASGVGTFVRTANAELAKLGVDSRVVTCETQLNDCGAADIFHIHGMWRKLHHSAAKLARERGIKTVWSTHGMTSPWAMRHKWWKKLPAWWLYQRRDLRSAEAVHCTSETEVEWNRAAGITRTFIAPLGAILPTWPTPSSEPRTPQKALLFVGRLYPVKAIDRIIRAFKLTPHDGWQLRIVGPDEAGHLAELRSLCAELGTASAIVFTGPKFGAELAAEYAVCDCAILVSHTENFGATVVDAMVHGKPVITGTKTPWRIVAERGCGWWTDNAPESLSKVMAEMMSLTDAERAEMGMKGRALVEERFTWQAVAKQLLAVYQQLQTCPSQG